MTMEGAMRGRAGLLLIALIFGWIAGTEPAAAQAGICLNGAAEVKKYGDDLVKKIRADTSIPLPSRNRISGYQNCIKNHFYNLMRVTRSAQECADLRTEYYAVSAEPAAGNHLCELP